MSDNIVAIATPLNNAALGIIRVSGESVIYEISKIFSKDLTKYNQNSLIHGYIRNNDKVIDEVIISLYIAPKSFTGENLIEITTHGGQLIMQEVLSLILSLNIRLAEPGEFSKRAYLNQKMDLIQAEAIMDLINAESKVSLDIARNGLLKKTSSLLDKPISLLLDLLTKMEVNIDYPEYDVDQVLSKEITINSLNKILNLLKNIIDKSSTTYILNKGIKIVLIGKPNVGKSSLLNALVGESRAIVTNIAGTTRDVIEASTIYQNIKLTFIDTAGLRKTDDKIERIGVSLTKKNIKLADLIILILDNSTELCSDEIKLLNSIKSRNHLVVINKSDLRNKLVLNNITPHLISCKKNEGINELKEKIIKSVNINTNTNDLVGLFSLRQITEIKKVYNDLKAIIESFDEHFYETIAQGVRQVYQNLLLITGKVYNQDIEKNIFKNFCLGK